MKLSLAGTPQGHTNKTASPQQFQHNQQEHYQTANNTTPDKSKPYSKQTTSKQSERSDLQWRNRPQNTQIKPRKSDQNSKSPATTIALSALSPYSASCRSLSLRICPPIFSIPPCGPVLEPTLCWRGGSSLAQSGVRLCGARDCVILAYTSARAGVRASTLDSMNNVGIMHVWCAWTKNCPR